VKRGSCWALAERGLLPNRIVSSRRVANWGGGGGRLGGKEGEARGLGLAGAKKEEPLAVGATYF